jgi:uncharacterized protein YbjT (DUF2867 family)
LQAAGAEAVVADLESLEATALAGLIGTADAIVFAAGAGPGSGPERKWTLDHAGAVKLIDVAKLNGISRYVIVSSIGANSEAEDDGGFGTYLRAKGQADDDLVNSGLDYTILRPGPLTNDPGTGTITIGAGVDDGPIARDDVAATIAAVLETPATSGLTLGLGGGGLPIEQALAELERGWPTSD